MTEDGTLTIDPVQESDSGVYVCEALNVEGSASAKAEVQVRPSDQGESHYTGPYDLSRVLRKFKGETKLVLYFVKDNYLVTHKN